MCNFTKKGERSLQTTSINCILYLFIVIIFCEIFFSLYNASDGVYDIILNNFSGCSVICKDYCYNCRIIFDGLHTSRYFHPQQNGFQDCVRVKEKTFSTIRATTRTTSRVYETCRFYIFFFCNSRAWTDTLLCVE